MKSGWKASSFPAAIRFSRSCLPLASMWSRPPLRMYHWRDVTISSGLSPFSKKFVMRDVGLGSPSISPLSVSASTSAFRAEKAVFPAMAS